MAKVKAVAERGQWSGQFGFIFAAVGSAVGLGNIWRFPGVAYTNGGGAFLIPYIVALLTAGIPILLFDTALGHRFRGSAPLAFRRAAGRTGETLGWFQVLISAFIVLYYTAVIGWAASYFVFSFNGAWNQTGSTQDFFIKEYLQVAEAPFTTQIALSVFIPTAIVWLVAMVVMSGKVSKGLQLVNVIAVPALLVSFGALVIGALLQPGAIDGVNAFFTPNLEVLSKPDVWIAAYGQIFFSLSIAFGIMLNYSSYQKRRANVSGSGVLVAFSNSAFELLAGVGVFAALGFMAHQQHIPVAEIKGISGPILAFVTFPAIISQMPMAPLFGTLFFGSLLLAGFSSLVSIFEAVVGAIIDKFGISRAQVVWGFGIVFAIISLGLFATTSGLTALDTVDNFVNNIGVVGSAVIGLVLITVIMRRGGELARHISAISTFKVGFIWQALITVISPAVITFMLVQVILKLVEKPYEGYPAWYVGIFGWGLIAFMVVFAIALTFVPWKKEPADFIPWPHLPGAKPPVGFKNLRATGANRVPIAEQTQKGAN
ncbi:MAG: sodium-dependent transporter [Microbacteriaceae bacterium]|nr:sodium-dependent transporter [Microbacteriaceae bacterium]